MATGIEYVERSESCRPRKCGEERLAALDFKV
jgi:hypothetical protein